MKRYVEYTITDIPWLTELPSHWCLFRAKRLFSNPKEKNENNNEKNVLSLTLNGVIRNDVDNPIGLSPSDYSTYQVFEKDNLVFKLIDLENISTSRVGLVPERGIMSSAYIRFVARCNLNIRFFYTYFYSLWLRNIFNGLGAGVRQTLSSTELLDIKIPVPPRAEQDQIVRFLDWKTAKIDKLIEGYQKQIALLEEKKLSYIDRLITGKENLNSTFVDSGVAWIGNIPSHWKVDKVKNHFQILKRIAGKEGYDVVSITQQGLKIKDISSNEGQMASSYAKYQLIYPNEYAMNHMDLLTGYIGLSKMFGVTSPDYRVFTLTDVDNCDLIYYLYVFQMGYKRKIFYGLGRGAANKGRWRMPAIHFKNYEIPIPPIEEQKEIVLKTQRYEETIDTTIKSIYKQISLLKEYRTRLISDVVTGQIDVRDEAIPETR